MKKTLFLLLPLLAISLLFSSCGGGWETTESGIDYQLVVHNEDSAKPAEGDIVFLKLLVKTESADSVLFNSTDVKKREGTEYYEMLKKPTFDGDYSEILAMMHVGDSAVCKVDADSFFKNVFKVDSLPKFIEEGSKVIFEIKMVKYMTLDKFKVYYGKIQKEKDDKAQAIENKAIAEYVAANKITTTPEPSGLYFIEVKKGTGKKIEAGLIAAIKYTGRYLDGTAFDSTGTRPPYEVPVGAKMVIPGWDEALLKMSEGSVVKLIVPYKLAYGSRGYPPFIPPYSTLAFDMEVVKVTKMEEPKAPAAPGAPKQTPKGGK